MSNTLKNSQLTLHDYCDEARAIVAELADLTGEQYTLQNRLQWIDNRLDALRLRLQELRKE